MKDLKAIVVSVLAAAVAVTAMMAIAGEFGASDIVGTCLLKEDSRMVGGRELRCANPTENVWVCEENR